MSLAERAFLLLWLLATAALAAAGQRGVAVQAVVFAAYFLIVIALTRRFTTTSEPTAAPPNAAVASVVILAIVVLTGLDAAVRDPSGPLAQWSSFHWSITARLAPILRVLDDESIDNSLRYIVLPGFALIVLGWRAVDLGFGRARAGATGAVLLWCVPPLLLYGGAAAAMGHGKPALLAHRFFIDVFRNGYAEEILMRGMLLRVTQWRFGNSAGNVVQALVFGLWHFGADLREVHVIWLAIADGIATQALAGYAFGVLTQRTGNVGAAGAAHALIDGGAIFG